MLTLPLLCLNILFTSIVIILFILSIYRLFKLKAICHWNFWIYLFQLHINLAFFSLAVSTMTICRYLRHQYPDLQLIKNIGAFAAYSSSYNNGILIATLAIICIERLIATIKNKTYEFSKSYFFLICGLLVSYCFGGINLYIWYFADINYLFFNFLFYTVYATLIMFTFMLYYKNKKLIRLSQSATIVLTQRYQIHENVRMIKYALPFLCYPSIGLISVGAFVIILDYTNLSLNTEEMNAIYFTGSNLFILISFYRANFKQISAYLHNGFNRKNIIIPKKEKYEEKKKEGDIYFAQFKIAW